MKMKILEFDGEPTEFKSVEHLFAQAALVSPNSSPPLESSQPKVPKKMPSLPPPTPVQAIRRMLSRRSIKQGQRDLYATLANGEFLVYSDFLAKMGRKGSQMAGLFGALGRRINGTPEIHEAGLVGKCSSILEWDERQDGWYIRLLPHTIEALKEEEII